jgi:hypothetical protein
MYSEFWTKLDFNPVRTKILCYRTKIKRTNTTVMYVVMVEIRYNEQDPCLQRFLSKTRLLASLVFWWPLSAVCLVVFT